MPGLEDLYREIILDHYRAPRNRGELPTPPAHRVEGFNPLCGDEVVLYLEVGPDGTVSDLRTSGQGCSISQASTSMMSAAVKGKSVEEARRLIRELAPEYLRHIVQESDNHRTVEGFIPLDTPRGLLVLGGAPPCWPWRLLRPVAAAGSGCVAAAPGRDPPPLRRLPLRPGSGPGTRADTRRWLPPPAGRPQRGFARSGSVATTAPPVP